MKEVKAGSTQRVVQWAWGLVDDSDVTIEVKEQFVQNDDAAVTRVSKVQ